MRVGLAFNNILSDYLVKTEGFCQIDSSLTSSNINYEIQRGNFDYILYMVNEQDVCLCQNLDLAEEKFKIESLVNSGISVIYISSEHIFNGYCGPYKVTDYADPLNVKGEVDLQNENIVLKNNGKIIRTSDFFMEYSYNFVTGLLRELAFNNIVNVENKRLVNPTYIPHFTEALVHVLNTGYDNYPDVLHIAGCEYINKYRFYLEVAEFWDFDQKLIKPVLNKTILSSKVGRTGGLDVNLSYRLKIPIYSHREGMVVMKETFTKETLLKQIKKGDLNNGYSNGCNGTSNLFFNCDSKNSRILINSN